MSEIIISSGVVSTGLTVEAGDVITIQAGGKLVGGTVKNGGVLHGLFGAEAQNLVTETGAVVDLAYSATSDPISSGLMLTGDATAIAADTLFWNGQQIHGATVGGVLSGISVTDPAAESFRFCVGDGIIVSDAQITSRARIYTYGTAVISNTTILENGNIGMTEAATIGRNITVGGAGVAEGKATLQIRGTAYDTVVSEGGRANVYKTASDTEVYAGGFLEVKDGGSAFGAEIHGGSMGVSSGAYASGANVSGGASMVVLDGGVGQTVKILDGGAFTMTGDTAVVKDFTVEEGGKFSVLGDAASGALISGANITPTGGNSNYALIDRATVYDMNVNNGETANSMTVKRATWTNGTVQGGSNSTDRLYVDLNYYVTANNVTFTTDATESATGICLVSAGANGAINLNDVTVRNFAYLEYARGVARNLSILDGGYMYQRATAVVSGITISGVRNGVQAAATMNIATNRMTDARIGSGGKLTVNAGEVSGATVLSGGTFSANGAGIELNDLTVAEGGKLYVNGTADSRTVISKATITPMSSGAGVAVVSAKNADIYDMNILNGKTSNFIRLESATWTGGTVQGGSTTSDRLYVNLSYADTVNGVTFTTDATTSSNLVCFVSAGGNGDVYLNDVTAKNFAYIEYARGSANNLTILDGARVGIRLSVKVSGAVISGMRGGTLALLTMAGANNQLTDAFIGSGGKVTVTSGVAENILVNKGGTLDVQAAGSAALAWLPSTWSGTVTQSEGATVTQLERDKAVYYGGSTLGLIEKADTMNGLDVADGNSVLVYDGGTLNGATFSGGVKMLYLYEGGRVSNVSLVGNGDYLYASGGVAENIDVTSSGRVYISSGAVLSNAVFTSKGYLLASGGTVSGATFASGGSMYYFNTAASCSDLVIGNGGIVTLGANSAHVQNVTILAGGSMSAAYYSAFNAISGTLTMDLNGGANLGNYYLQRRLAGIKADKLVIADENATAGNVYNLVSSADQNSDCNFNFRLAGGTYAMSVNAVVIDPLKDLSWKDTRNSNNNVRLEVTAAGHTIAAVTNAAALATSGTTLNGSDREAKWTQNTTVASSVYLADGMTAGNAWLEIDGATVGSALYGAAAGQNFAGVVNLKLTSGSIRNLAGGAASGGSVKAVNFEMAGGELAGNTYAGGMGTVAGAVKTTVAGGELAAGKNLYGGALWNKLSNATSVGEVNLTVKAGTIDGNVYGASAVKTGTISTTAATDARHTVGDVTLTLAGGTAANAEFCAFAGGYATGTDSAKLASVYDVGDVTLTLTGGSWGDATDVRGGRGVFGGVMASGVKATAGNVSITVEAGTVANVFGGGWAQKGGISAVENVEITVTGGTVANIFGSGRRSVQGESTTVVENVSITLAGGNVTGNVFARGITDGDAVTGDVSVTVTGSVNYGCNFYGFSRNTGEEDTAVLTFSDYTGTISGEVGGFKEITLAGDTAMAFDTAAKVTNTAWIFDVAERTTSATAFASCETATFSGATVSLNIGEDQALTGAWSIFDGGEATTYGEFDVLVNGTSILPGALALDEQIADGDYAGWGFTVEDTVLKFKNLA